MWTLGHLVILPMKVTKCPTKLYQRVIRHRERAETTETTERLQRKR